MKKIILVLLLFFVAVQSTDLPNPKKVGYVRREYRAFVGAFKQMRRSGFKSCSSSQKKRIVIVGLVGAVGAMSGSRGLYVLLSKQLALEESFFPQSEDEYLPVVSSPEVKKSRTITVDLDKVMSGNEIMLSRFVGLLCKLIWRHPLRALRIIPHLYSLKKQGKFQSKSMKGASNIIQMILESPDGQISNLAPEYLDEIVDRAINPKPIKDMVYTIASLKNAGYRVIGATNQDYKIFKAYKAKMNDLGINMDKLFDWVLTTKADSQEVSDNSGGYVRVCDDENIFMLNTDVAKPDKKYYETLQEIESKVFGRNPELCIHIDDRLENVTEAKKVEGFNAIQMHLSSKLFSHWTQREQSNAVEQVKTDLKEFGIEFKNV